MALYAFDGTWNIRDEQASVDHVQSPLYGEDMAAARDTEETNVSRFADFYGEDHEYIQGLGTRLGWIGRILGGAFGFGGRYRVRRMYYRLTRRYFQGDTKIDIIGFSRGAALAVHFANVIYKHGLRNPDGPKHIAWKYFPDLGWTFRHPKKSDKDVASPPIDFLGLFDAVASFGYPVKPFRNRGTFWKVHRIPQNVKGTFHAMALDEVRDTFELVRPKFCDDARAAHAAMPKHERPTLYEIWFRGVHSNIGGSYHDRGLSDIALAWMMEMAIWQWERIGDRRVSDRLYEALQLLEPVPGPRPNWLGLRARTLEPDPDGVIGRPVAVKRRSWRDLGVEPRVHHSVFLRRTDIFSDYGSSNIGLLRRVPRNARSIYDPPFFYRDTLLESAERFAQESFYCVPVRQKEWLAVDGVPVFRSDNWIAHAINRSAADRRTVLRRSFVDTAKQWFLAGRPDSFSGFPITWKLLDKDENCIEDGAETIDWIVKVLRSVEPYLPRRWSDGSANARSLKSQGQLKNRAKGAKSPDLFHCCTESGWTDASSKLA